MNWKKKNALDKPSEDNDNETTPFSINYLNVQEIHVDASIVHVNQLDDLDIK